MTSSRTATIDVVPGPAPESKLRPFAIEAIDDEPGGWIVATSLAVAYSVLAERRADRGARGRRPHITAVAMRPIEGE